MLLRVATVGLVLLVASELFGDEEAPKKAPVPAWANAMSELQTNVMRNGHFVTVPVLDAINIASDRLRIALPYAIGPGWVRGADDDLVDYQNQIAASATAAWNGLSFPIEWPDVIEDQINNVVHALFDAADAIREHPDPMLPVNPIMPVDLSLLQMEATRAHFASMNDMCLFAVIAALRRIDEGGIATADRPLIQAIPGSELLTPSTAGRWMRWHYIALAAAVVLEYELSILHGGPAGPEAAVLTSPAGPFLAGYITSCTAHATILSRFVRGMRGGLSHLLATPSKHYVLHRNEVLDRLRALPKARRTSLTESPVGSHRALADALVAMLPPKGVSDVRASQATFLRLLEGRTRSFGGDDVGGDKGFTFADVLYEKRDTTSAPADISDAALRELAAKSPGSLTKRNLGGPRDRHIDDAKLTVWIRLEAILELVKRNDPNGPAILLELLDSGFIAEMPHAASVLLMCVEATESTKLLDRFVAALAQRYQQGRHQGALSRLVQRRPDAVRRYLSSPERGDADFRARARWKMRSK